MYSEHRTTNGKDSFYQGFFSKDAPKSPGPAGPARPAGQSGPGGSGGASGPGGLWGQVAQAARRASWASRAIRAKTQNPNNKNQQETATKQNEGGRVRMNATLWTRGEQELDPTTNRPTATTHQPKFTPTLPDIS